MNTHNLHIFLILLFCPLAVSCINTGLDNATLIEKVGQIEGSYSLVSASFSEAVDLYGQGKESTDILNQMKAAGKWHGVFDVDGNNPMGRSIIFPVLSVNEEAQANFYVPFSVGPNEGLLPDNLGCSVGLAEYQFHYTVNNTGQIVLGHSTDEKFWAGAKLSNIEVRIVPENKTVVIEANTNFYDLSKEGWFGGHIILVYKKSDSLSETVYLPSTPEMTHSLSKMKGSRYFNS